MAITNPSSNFLCFLLSTCLLLCLLCCSANREVETTVDHHHQNHIIKVSSLLPSTVCSTPTSTSTSINGPNGRSPLKIVHRHGPCSQVHRGKKKTKSRDQMLKQILLEDRLRVNSIQQIFWNDTKGIQAKNSKVKLPASPGASLGAGNYFVSIGFGTPKKDFSVIFDTGSAFTWIQCKPCVGSCYQQQEPIFDPSQSTSYSDISCKTTECSQLRSATSTTPQCSKSTSTCIYGMQYGDRSYSSGYFAQETLTLSPSDVFPKFQFGCGQLNRGLFGLAAGLLGLGRDKLSVVSQTTEKYGGIFSYCLPTASSSTGYLSFGERDVSSKVKFTPLFTDPQGPSFYFLDLMDISVGGTKLGISASVFASSGTIIDSGTIITRLPPTAYEALRTSFRKSLLKYPLGQPVSLLDTCYDFRGFDTISVPIIQLFFRGGTTVKIDLSGIFLIASKDVSQVCLAFAGNNDPNDIAILGNMQQQTLEVIYDVAKGRLGFGPGSCG